MENTGFDGDKFVGPRINQLCLGTVVDRDDPLGICRIRANIPGIMERTPWARPKHGGSKNEGVASIPPNGADVYIQFINGDRSMPVWERADFGVVNGKSEVFKEHIDPDIHVFGIGPFRLVVDNRTQEGVVKTARAKLVKVINGEEQDIVWIEVNEENSCQVHADSALGFDATIIDIDAPVVQIKKRKVIPSPKGI